MSLARSIVSRARRAVWRTGLKRYVKRGEPVPVTSRGRRYYLNPDESALYHAENSIEKLWRLVETLDPSTRTIFDVGANCGLFSAFAATAFPNAEITAFEPAADLASVMKLNLAGTKVRVVQAAVSDRPGIATLYVNPAAQQTNSLNRSAVDIFASEAIRKEQVPTIVLDEFAVQEGIASIDVLKVDVQGFEGAVFRGARSILPNVQKLVVESTWMDISSVAGIHEFARHYGFRYGAVVNPVYMGADLVFARSEITSDLPGLLRYRLDDADASETWL